MIFYSTYRFRHVGLKNLDRNDENGSRHILATWHQNLLAGILAQNKNPHIAIASRSKDAEPVAYALKKMGHQVARGSSKRDGRDKGGKEAKDMMVELLKTGLPGAVTIDGPKGPAKEVKPGIIVMAKYSGAVIVPYTTVADNYWSFNSWDKFRFPKPFAKIICHYGEPITVNENSDFSKIKVQIKNALDMNEQKIPELLEKWNELTDKKISPSLTLSK